MARDRLDAIYRTPQYQHSLANGTRAVYRLRRPMRGFFPRIDAWVYAHNRHALLPLDSHATNPTTFSCAETLVTHRGANASAGARSTS